jgi:hypothetical protein
MCRVAGEPPPRGRLRYPDRLRRPRWRNGNLKLTFHLDYSAGADHHRVHAVRIQFGIKWFELLKQIAPGVTKAAVLRDLVITSSGLASSLSFTPQ